MFVIVNLIWCAWNSGRADLMKADGALFRRSFVVDYKLISGTPQPLAGRVCTATSHCAPVCKLKFHVEIVFQVFIPRCF